MEAVYVVVIKVISSTWSLSPLISSSSIYSSVSSLTAVDVILIDLDSVVPWLPALVWVKFDVWFENAGDQYPKV